MTVPVAPPLPGALGSYPSYGLSMRFEVKVDDLVSLGRWSSCTGLKVGLKMKPVPQGGDYLSVPKLPERLEYPRITLERAIVARESRQVQAWLADYVRWWQIYPNTAGGEVKRTSVTITLLDYQLMPVMTWTLKDAYPVSWTGPNLSARDNSVATEKLEFEHEGFLAV